MIAGLELAGIDVVSTANNHSRDCGRRGVEFTLDWLVPARDRGGRVRETSAMKAAHRGIVIERNGVKFGFLAYTYDQSNGNHLDTDDRVAVMDVDRMRRDVRGLENACGRGDRFDACGHPVFAQAELISLKPDLRTPRLRRARRCWPVIIHTWSSRGSRYRDGVIFIPWGNLSVRPIFSAPRRGARRARRGGVRWDGD